MKYLYLLPHFLSCNCLLWICIASRCIVSVLQTAFTLPPFIIRWGRFHLIPPLSGWLSTFHKEIASASPFSKRGRQNPGVNQLETNSWCSFSIFFSFGINHFLWLVSLCKLDINCTSFKKMYISLLPPWNIYFCRPFSIGLMTANKEKKSKNKNSTCLKNDKKIFL